MQYNHFLKKSFVFYELQVLSFGDYSETTRSTIYLSIDKQLSLAERYIPKTQKCRDFQSKSTRKWSMSIAELTKPEIKIPSE